MAKPRKARVAPRKSPQQERSRATVAALLDATARVLARDGYDHCTTNRVAEVAGVSVGSLYQYFPSKEALVDALQDRHMAKVREAVTAGLANVRELPLAAAARRLIETLAHAHTLDPAVHRVLNEDLPRSRRLKRMREWDELLHAGTVLLLAQRRAELRVTDLDTAAFVVLVAVDAVQTATLAFRPAIAPAALLDATTDLVVRYLQKDG